GLLNWTIPTTALRGYPGSRSAQGFRVIRPSSILIMGSGPRIGERRYPIMSYGGSENPRGIQVTFLDQTGAKSVKAEIAFSVPVSRILPNIITKMNLPTTSPDGQPMSYSLDHKEGGKRLIESQTLPEANVQNGDHLIVYPEVVAGWP